ncbi:MAG: AsmA-like C-terminal region-containing protein [bacterium]
MGERRSRSRVVVIVLGVLVLAVVAAALVARAVFTPERLRTTVVKAGESALGLPVELRGAQLSLLPLGISLEGLRIAGASPSDPPLLALESGRVRVALAPLLRGRVGVAELRFERPVFSLRRDAAGLVLPGKLGAPPAAGGAAGGTGAASGPAPAAPPVTIEKLQVVNGTLRLSGPTPPGDVTVDGIDLSARIDLEGGGSHVRSRGELRLASLSLPALAAYRKTLDALSPTVQFDLDYRGAQGTLAIDALRLHAPPLDLGAHGNLSGLPQKPRIELVVEPATLTLQDLLPLVPPAMIPDGRRPHAKGDVHLSARVSGPLGDPKRPPSFLADVGFDGAELGMEGFNVGVKDLRGGVTLSDSSTAFRALSASLGGSTLRLDGRVAGPTAPDSGRVDMAVAAAIDLGVVEQAGLLPKGGSLRGRLDADVQLHGRASAPASADLRGTMKLTDGQVTMPTLAAPVKDLRGELAFEGADAVLKNVSGSIGSSAFHGDGRIRNVLAKTPLLSLHGTCPRLDLVELMPPPPAATSGASSAPGGKPGGAAPTSAGPTPPPLIPELPPITADLDLAVDSLIAPNNTTLASTALTAHLAGGKCALDARAARAHFGPDMTIHDVTGQGEMTSGKLDATFRSPRADAYRMPLTAIDGKVKVQGTHVDVTDVKAACFTGKIAGSALMDLTDPVSPSFQIDSQAAGIQANDFVSALTPAKDVLHGTLDVTSKFSGKGIDPKAIAQSLVADGTLAAHGGQLARSPATQAIWNALSLGEKQTINFRELLAPFSVSGGKLITKNLVLGSPEAEWRANGSVAFDGTLDYGVEVELGEELAAQFRKRAGGDVARMLADTSGKITLDLRVTGAAARPQVTLDTSKLAERAAANLRNRTSSQLNAAKDQLVGKLLKGAGADSTHADSAAAKPNLQDALKGLLGGKKK